MDNSQENDQLDQPAEATAAPVLAADAVAEFAASAESDEVMPEAELVVRPVPGRAQIKCIIEGALLASGETLTIDRFGALFEDHERPSAEALRQLLDEMAAEYEGRGVELKEVASGFRIQVRKEYGPWVSRLWTEKPPRYSRALLETMALIAYRQPITRGEIEDIRGVTVSSEMVKSLMERDWIRIVGHRDVPGRPALYATTHDFLDYFDLKSLDELPTLSEIRDLDKVNEELQLDVVQEAAAGGGAADPGAASEPAVVKPYSSSEQDEDDLDLRAGILQVDEVLKRVEESFRRRDDVPVEDAAADAGVVVVQEGSASPEGDAK